MTAEGDADGKEHPAGEGGVIAPVDHGDVAHLALQSRDAGASEVSAEFLASLVGGLTEDEETFADVGDVGFFRRDRDVEGNSDRIWNAGGHFPEEEAALEGKDGTPKAVEPDRDDRGAGAAGDEFEAFFKLEQRAAAAEFAFGKNADDFACGQFFRGEPDSVLGVRFRDRDGFDPAKNEVERGDVVDGAVDQKSHGTRAGELQHNGVHVGEVVGNEEHPAGAREISQALDGDAINEGAQEAAKEALQKGESGGHGGDFYRTPSSGAIARW